MTYHTITALTLTIIVCVSYTTQRSINDEYNAIKEKADTFIALPWSNNGVLITRTTVKTNGVLLVNVFGSPMSGNTWKVINEKEMKEKWGVTCVNVNEHKEGQFFELDDVTGSRKFHHKGVWKFLFKVGNTVTDKDDPIIIELRYGNESESESVQSVTVKVNVSEYVAPRHRDIY